MTNLQNSIQKMSLSTISYLESYASQIAMVPNLSAFIKTARSINTQIQAMQELQEFNRTGFTVNKNQLKAELILQAIDVARKVKAYAINTNNQVLLAEINYKESYLKKSTDMNLKSQCLAIYNRANDNVDNLELYGITPAILVNLQTALTDYLITIPKGRVEAANTTQVTQQIKPLLKSLVDNYKKMDGLIEMLKISQPNFYNEYKNVRKIIRIGGSSLALKASAVDALTGEMLPKVNFTFIASVPSSKLPGTISKIIIRKKTASKGEFRIKNMTDGSYQVAISKLGFKDQNETINVISGEMIRMNVAMEKSE